MVLTSGPDAGEQHVAADVTAAVDQHQCADRAEAAKVEQVEARGTEEPRRVRLRKGAARSTAARPACRRPRRCPSGRIPGRRPKSPEAAIRGWGGGYAMPVTVIASFVAGGNRLAAFQLESAAAWPNSTSCSVCSAAGGDWSAWVCWAKAGLAAKAASETVDRMNGLTRRIGRRSPGKYAVRNIPRGVGAGKQPKMKTAKSRRQSNSGRMCHFHATFSLCR